MKRILVILIMAVSVLGLMACTGGTPNEYEITIENQSDWNEAAFVEYYDLSGSKKAEASIKDGKVSVDLEDGTYVVLVKDAPESVDYDIIVLTSTDKKGKITLKNAEKSSIPQYSDKLKFSYGVIVLENDIPQRGLQVLMCTLGNGESGGICMSPESTDKNGFAQIKVSTIEYHVSILTERGDIITEINQTVSARRRFFIVDLQNVINN